MSTYEKIVIESDTRGRVSISALDADGYGHGHRIAGPKYNNGGGKPLASVELDNEDVASIRGYLRMWDEVNLIGRVPDEVLVLSRAVDQYLAVVATQVQFPEYADKPHNVERRQQSLTDLKDAITAAGEVLNLKG